MMLTTREAAERLNVSMQHVSLLCRMGDIHSVREGQHYSIPESEIELYATRPPKDRRHSYGPLRHAAGGGKANEIAAQVGVTTRTIERWKIAGLTDLQADRAACRIGLHPQSIWGDWQ